MGYRSQVASIIYEKKEVMDKFKKENADIIKVLDDEFNDGSLKYLGSAELTSEIIEKLRGIINESGAVENVEGLIENLTFDALTASRSDEIAEDSQELLAALAASATARKS
jgi:geranylgeranyl diphosphate synthase type I